MTPRKVIGSMVFPITRSTNLLNNAILFGLVANVGVTKRAGCFSPGRQRIRSFSPCVSSKPFECFRGLISFGVRKIWPHQTQCDLAFPPTGKDQLTNLAGWGLIDMADSAHGSVEPFKAGCCFLRYCHVEGERSRRTPSANVSTALPIEEASAPSQLCLRNRFESIKQGIILKIVAQRIRIRTGSVSNDKFFRNDWSDFDPIH